MSQSNYFPVSKTPQFIDLLLSFIELYLLPQNGFDICLIHKHGTGNDTIHKNTVVLFLKIILNASTSGVAIFLKSHHEIVTYRYSSFQHTFCKRGCCV